MINAYAYVFGELGYNIHARKFFQALNRITPVCMVPMDPPSGNSYPIEVDFVPMIKRQDEINLSQPAICLNYGNQFHKFNGSYLIGYTVFEYTKIAADWLHMMRQMDEVWTTSQWGKEVLMQNGLAGEMIGVVPEGADPAIYCPNQKPRSDAVFRFLSVGKWEPRKGQVELLRAWSDVFGDKRDVELYVAWHNPFIKNFSLKDEIQKLSLKHIPSIHVVNNVPTAFHMAQLYNMVDCFVLPTRAEGWGLPIMEAMSCGLPVITTKYSAITEYATQDNAYLINVGKFVDVYDPRFFPTPGSAGVWAEVDYDHLKELLWHVYTHRDEAREKGRKASESVRAQWTWDHAARKAHALLEHAGLRLA
jgi:glycosyltransferase involved in cell wall biosynthesis